MNRILLALFFIQLLPLFLPAQLDIDADQDKEIQKLKKEIQDLKNSNFILIKEVKALNTKFLDQNQVIDILRQSLTSQEAQLDQKTTQLGTRIEETGNNLDQRLETLRNAVGKNSVYWMLAFLVAILLAAWIFIFLRKRLIQNKDELTSQILQTKKTLEEEGVKLDAKLADILESQLKLWKLDREAALKATEEKSSPTTSVDEEPDHSLAVKVADEIIRIRQNLQFMDPSTKGLKQLTAAVGRIQDNFEANGYEIVNMLNKPFGPGLKAIVNFRTDDNLKPGEQIITRIIKPQINYNGLMVQSAQIEVSQGE